MRPTCRLLRPATERAAFDEDAVRAVAPVLQKAAVVVAMASGR
jgi:hypothetical protein